MSDTVYWAVLLYPGEQGALLARVPPKFQNVYAEHMTIAFRPSKETEEKLEKELGNEVALAVTGLYEDSKGQAVSVNGPRVDSGPAHITISCAPGTPPVYSNTLIKNSQMREVSFFTLTGTVAKYTASQGWITE